MPEPVYIDNVSAIGEEILTEILAHYINDNGLYDPETGKVIEDVNA